MVSEINYTHLHRHYYMMMKLCVNVIKNEGVCIMCENIQGKLERHVSKGYVRGEVKRKDGEGVKKVDV